MEVTTKGGSRRMESKAWIGVGVQVVRIPGRAKKREFWSKKAESIPADQDAARWFCLLRRRWVVERTFGVTLGYYRRLSGDYEGVEWETGEEVLFTAMSHDITKGWRRQGEAQNMRGLRTRSKRR